MQTLEAITERFRLEEAEEAASLVPCLCSECEGVYPEPTTANAEAIIEAERTRDGQARRSDLMWALRDGLGIGEIAALALLEEVEPTAKRYEDMDARERAAWREEQRAWDEQE